MNSKCRLLTTYFLKSFAPSNKYTSLVGVRFLNSKSWNVHPSIASTQALSNLGWSPHCGCNVRNYNATVPSSFAIRRHYVSIPSSDPTATQGNEQPEKKPSLYQRFKTMYRDYWYVLLPVHLVTSAAWFGSFFYMASSGVDVVGLLEQLNVPDKVINPFRNGHATTGYLAISYALYKIATPVRYTVTLGGTTISINYLKKWGYIKPIPSKEKLKEIYEDQKELLKGKGQTLKDNMMQSLKPTENIESKSTIYGCLFKDILKKSRLNKLNLKPNFIRFFSTNNEDEKHISFSHQLKDMFRKYWYILVPVHLITSLLWCLGFYYIAVSGIDIAALMERLKLNEVWIAPFRRGRHKTAGNLAVTYTLFHLFAPLRYIVTLGITSITKEFLKKKGFIASQKNKQQK